MIDQQKIRDLVNENKLDVRAIIIIALRAYGLTYREIGEGLGISKQAVHQLEQRYYKK